MKFSKFINLSLFLIILMSLLPLTVHAQTSSEDEPLITIVRQWAYKASATSQYGDDNWNAGQATGVPNTPTCGDQPTAWASANPDGPEELTLRFETAVVPSQVNIYETNGVGSIIEVGLIDAETGDILPIDDSADPRTECPAYFSLNLTPGEFPAVNGVVIRLDESLSGTWNEIDAVELVGIDEETAAALDEEELGIGHQWASSATATSQYGEDNWSAAQATGIPNTFGCGDIVTAWASATKSGVDELTLNFDITMIPIEIAIYESFNPGSITGVSLIEAETGDLVPITNSADDVKTPCPGIFVISLTNLEELSVVNGVVISLNQSAIGDWNEIDAVEMIGVIETSTLK